MSTKRTTAAHRSGPAALAFADGDGGSLASPRIEVSTEGRAAFSIWNRGAVPTTYTVST